MNTFIIDNNNLFDASCIADHFLLNELRELCNLESLLYAQIFLNDDYTLLNEVKLSFSKFHGMDNMEYKLVHKNVIEETLSEIEQSLKGVK